MFGAPIQEQMDEEQAHLNSFWAQYTSVIMIVLTFIVGTFASSAMRKPIMADGEEPQAPIARLSYKDLFVADGTELEPSTFEALSFVLEQHDVDYKIEIPSRSAIDTVERTDEEAIGLALARSVKLYREFLRHGIPSDAVSIVASNQKTTEQVRIEMTEERQ